MRSAPMAPSRTCSTPCRPGRNCTSGSTTSSMRGSWTSCSGGRGRPLVGGHVLPLTTQALAIDPSLQFREINPGAAQSQHGPHVPDVSVRAPDGEILQLPEYHVLNWCDRHFT